MSDDMRFSSREIRYLESLPAVEKVVGDRIIYRDGFKRDCVRRYAAGESPSLIFSNAGLDSSLVGYKRIERCIARWKHTIRFDESDAVGDMDYTVPPEQRWVPGLRHIQARAADAQADVVLPAGETDVHRLIIAQQARRIDRLERELAALREQLRQEGSHYLKVPIRRVDFPGPRFSNPEVVRTALALCWPHGDFCHRMQRRPR